MRLLVPGPRGACENPKPGKEGDDDIKGAVSGKSVACRIRQHRDDLVHLDKRAWPPVRKYERSRVGVNTFYVHVMDDTPLDVDGELR